MSLRRRHVLSGIGVGIGGSIFGIPTAASSTERVFVHPDQSPVATLVDPIRDIGGSIRFTYDNFDFVAAEIPVGRRDELLATPGIAFIEDDEDAGIPAGWSPSVLDLLDPNGDVDCSIHPTQQASWGWERIGVHAVESNGAGVDIGILDTGIESAHCSLDVAGGRNFTDTIPNSNVEDRHGHGTHVAGIASALDNDIGVVGVAPNADVYAVKILDDSGSGTYSSLIAGIDWCMTNDVELISMSLGGESPTTAVDRAIEAADDAGHLLVCAAGNNENKQDGRCAEETMTYPATHPDVLAVTAMNEDETLASYSGIGTAIDLLAPGTEIVSTYINNNYASASGTSMACPFVTGVAALIWQAHGFDGPGGNDVVTAVLQSTAESVLETCEEGYGLVDAQAAVDADGPAADDEAAIDEADDRDAIGSVPANNDTAEPMDDELRSLTEAAPRWSGAGLMAGMLVVGYALLHRLRTRE